MPSPVQRLKEMDINIIEDTSGKGKDFSKIKQEDVVILPALRRKRAGDADAQ